MVDGDRLHKFRNRSAAGPRGLPQTGEKLSWWSRLLGQVPGGRRPGRPGRPLAPTVLEATPPLPTFEPSGRPHIEPLRVAEIPLTLPRPRAGGSAGGPGRQRVRPQQTGFETGAARQQSVGPSARRRSPQPSPDRRRPSSSPAPSGTRASRIRTAASPARSRPQNSRAKAARPARSGKMQAMVYALRLLILSVGVGVLAGTLLSVWDPAGRPVASNSQQVVTASPSPAPDALSQLTVRGAEIQPLKAAIQALAFQTPQLAPGVFLLDLNTNAYLDLGGGTLFSAASTIKLPILIAFFQDVDAGKIRLDEMLTLSQTAIAKESGDLQYQPVGTQIPALDTAVRMITISDNTATNMLIERLGGKAALTARFQSWGLTATVLNNLLADVEGTNTTTAKEMVWLLAQVNQGQLVSMTSRDRIIDIMRQTQSTGLLPNGLGADAKIAHKTGTLGLLLADVGLVDLPNGKRYAIAVLVKRPFQDEAATELIRQISKATFDYFIQPQSALSQSPSQSPAPNPVGSPSTSTPSASSPSTSAPSRATQPR